MGREAHDSWMKFLDLQTYRGQHWHTALCYTTETFWLFESFEPAFRCSVIGTTCNDKKLNSLLFFFLCHVLSRPEDLFSQV